MSTPWPKLLFLSILFVAAVQGTWSGFCHGKTNADWQDRGFGAETLRKWVRQAQRDAGHRPGLTTSERERLKELEREVRELRRANEILRKASAYFAQAELDRRGR